MHHNMNKHQSNQRSDKSWDHKNEKHICYHGQK